MKILREWKKVTLNDLDSISIELKGLVQKPSVIFLTGEVGVGKTTFVKSFTKEHSKGLADFEVQSPSYSVINDFGKIAHADFYRIESDEDIYYLELPLYCDDKEFIFIEWGIDYLKTISGELVGEFSFYELIITPEEIKDIRNYKLSGPLL